MKNSRLKADLALAFCSLIWGATFVLVKEALEHASVFAFLAVRFAIAGTLMAVIYLPALRRLTRTAIWAGTQVGFFMFTGYVFQTAGLRFTTPSKAAFITGSGIVLVPILMAFLWKRHISRWTWAGAAIAFAGLYLLTAPQAVELAEGGDAVRRGMAALNVGDLLVLVCAVLFAFHIIYVGRFTPHHSVAALSFVQVAATAVFSLLFLPLGHVTGLEPLRLVWTKGFIWAVIITAVGATAVAFSLQVWAQRFTTPTHTAILFSLEPVFAWITSYVVVGERLGGSALAGAGLILAGIFLAELKGGAPAAMESPASLATPADEEALP